jgi:hypothetical protein
MNFAGCPAVSCIVCRVALSRGLDGQDLPISSFGGAVSDSLSSRESSLDFALPASGCLVLGQRLQAACSEDGTLLGDAATFDPAQRWRGGSIASVLLFDSALMRSDLHCLPMDCQVDTCGDVVPINSWGAPTVENVTMGVLVDRGWRQQSLTVGVHTVCTVPPPPHTFPDKFRRECVAGCARCARCVRVRVLCTHCTVR